MVATPEPSADPSSVELLDRPVSAVDFHVVEGIGWCPVFFGGFFWYLNADWKFTLFILFVNSVLRSVYRV